MFCVSFSFLFYLHFHSLGWEVILIAKVHQTSSAWFTCIFPKNQKEWIDENGVNLRQVLSPPKTLPQSGFHTGQPWETSIYWKRKCKTKCWWTSRVLIQDTYLKMNDFTHCQACFLRNKNWQFSFIAKPEKSKSVIWGSSVVDGSSFGGVVRYRKAFNHKW